MSTHDIDIELPPLPTPPSLIQREDWYGAMQAYARSYGKECARAAIEAVLQSQDREEIMEMALCESRRLVLRIGQAYRFTPMDGCKTCEEMKEEHDQAYSIDHARRAREGG